MCLPTVVLAPTSGPKSGWRTVSTGVGTATTMMAAAVLHFLGAEVESDGPQLLAECHRQRQTDITESDNCNCAHDPVSFVCNAAILAENLLLGGCWDIADPALPSR